MTRVVSGLILALLTLALILLGSADLFLVVFVGVAVVCLLELYAMMDAGGMARFTILGSVSGAGLITVIYLENSFALMASLGAVFIVVFTASVLDEKVNAFQKAANTLFGALYVSVTLGALTLVRKEPSGDMYVIMLIVSNAFCDTFAYYTGRAIGRTPLAPAVSPKKTLEGFGGGVAGSIIGALAAKASLVPSMSALDAVVIGAIIGVLGPMGDLAESSIKRRMGVKDSGRIIPGHGGALDRLDSLMFSSVFFYIYIKLGL